MNIVHFIPINQTDTKHLIYYSGESSRLLRTKTKDLNLEIQIIKWLILLQTIQLVIFYKVPKSLVLYYQYILCPQNMCTHNIADIKMFSYNMCKLILFVHIDCFRYKQNHIFVFIKINVLFIFTISFNVVKERTRSAQKSTNHNIYKNSREIIYKCTG